jgi:hypothetical protein
MNSQLLLTGQSAFPDWSNLKMRIADLSLPDIQSVVISELPTIRA